jgi:DNA adenine methylase
MMHPFLKWAGGKSWLFRDKKFKMPIFDGIYREPFLGGGAAFFAQSLDSAVLSDANTGLIELYRVVQLYPDALSDMLKNHSSKHSENYYYETRSRKFQNEIERAAQFLYLNRMCFNGLYRVNNNGTFNVPIGSNKKVLLENDNFSAWSQKLSRVTLEVSDFETAIDQAKENDLIFADPPYTVRHNLNGFIKYNQKIFLWEDQVRLRDSLQRAHSRGVNFVLTNANHTSIHDLYSGFADIAEIERRSSIAGNKNFRGTYSEVIVTSR